MPGMSQSQKLPSNFPQMWGQQRKTTQDNTGRGARTGDDPVYLWQSILEEIYPRSQNQSGFMYYFPK